MDLFKELLDFILHIDHHLSEFVLAHGALTYGLLALIIFCETGLVITPFLPGDSLLFAAGALCAQGLLNLPLLCLILFIAAFCGDNSNYFIGKFIGQTLIKAKRSPIKKSYLDKTHQFYEKHGGKTVIVARFVPIVRTFAPFVAGLGSMTYKKYILNCVIGNILWIGVCTLAGYAFGNLPIVKENFSLVVFGIIGISLLPMVIGYLKIKFFNK
ncbi:MAG: hypothetical protein RIQ89_545 [Bacteroidota bacterium]